MAKAANFIYKKISKKSGKNNISYSPWNGKCHNFYEGQLVFSFIKNHITNGCLFLQVKFYDIIQK